MQLAKIAIENKAVTYFALLLILVVGTASYFQLGQLEDPDFTVKTAMVVTQYPGASPVDHLPLPSCHHHHPQPLPP